MAYKRILTIQDISCIGQCSMTVALPILSACGHEVCILPAAVLSTHTGGFGKPAVTHLTAFMEEAIRHWEENGIDFDIIYTGYLGSIPAVEIAGRIMDTMLAPGGITIVDPAMADHGKLYSGLDGAYAEAMTGLCRRADIILPNVTEAAMMTGLPCPPELSDTYIRSLLEHFGNQTVVLTGAETCPGKTGAAVWDGSQVHYRLHDKVGKGCHGTGDIFAAAFVGSLASGKSPVQAAGIAGTFTYTSIQNTFEDPAHWYGVKFETALPELRNLLLA